MTHPPDDDLLLRLTKLRDHIRGLDSDSGDAALLTEAIDRLSRPVAAGVPSEGPQLAVSREAISRFADAAVWWLCGLPDRVSPEDEPEMCRVTGEELRAYLIASLTGVVLAPPDAPSVKPIPVNMPTCPHGKTFLEPCPQCKANEKWNPGGEPNEPAVSEAAPLLSDGWRGIETLRREDGDVLFLCDGYKNDARHQMVGCLTPGGEYRSWPGRHAYAPTHWRPLPPPLVAEG